MAKRNKELRQACPFEAALDILGGKWKGLILFQLMKGTHRFNELKTSMPAISSKMLTQQLRELESHGLIIRKIYQEIPPRTEYSLTTIGKDLKIAFKHLKNWGAYFVE